MTDSMFDNLEGASSSLPKATLNDSQVGQVLKGMIEQVIEHRGIQAYFVARITST